MHVALGYDDLAVDVGGNAAHLVMDGGYNRDGFACDVDVGEVDTNLVHRWQTFVDGFGTQVVQLQQHVILVGTTATAFLDLLVHGAGHEVARRQILQSRCIALHEAFAIAVQQNGAFATAAFGQQHASTGHAGRVKLPKLHVFQRNASTCGHAQTVTRVDEGIGGCSKDAARAAGGQQHGFGMQNMQITGLHFQCSHTHHVTFGITD